MKNLEKQGGLIGLQDIECGDTGFVTVPYQVVVGLIN